MLTETRLSWVGEESKPALTRESSWLGGALPAYGAPGAQRAFVPRMRRYTAGSWAQTGFHHSRTSRGAWDDTHGSKSAEQAKTAPKTRPNDHSALRCRVSSQSSTEDDPQTQARGQFSPSMPGLVPRSGLRRAASAVSAAPTPAPAPSPAATGPSFAGWGLFALRRRGVTVADAWRCRGLLALGLAIRLAVRGLDLGLLVAASAVVFLLGDLDGEPVLLGILRNAHLGLQRTDDVLESAVVRWQHERVGSLAIGRPNDVFRRLRRSDRTLAPAARPAASSATASPRTTFHLRLLLRLIAL